MQAVRRNRAEWERLSARFEQSGQSMAEFCASTGLAPHTFAWWRWRLGHSARTRRGRDEVRLLPVEITLPSRNGAVVLTVSGVELRVEVGTDVKYVAELVTELRSRC